MSVTAKSPADAPTMKRPWPVTLSVVLVYVLGISDIVAGIGLIFLRYAEMDGDDGARTALTLSGAAVVLFGLATVGVASGVARASRLSRLLVTVFLGIGLILDLGSYLLDPASGWAGLVVQVLVGALIVVPLWTGRARRYFAEKARSRP